MSTDNGNGFVKKYRREINNIENRLKDLEKSRIYELSGSKMDGYLATNISKLRDDFHELLYKIETNEESIEEKLRSAFKKDEQQ
ncbi:hypothetical protein [Bacillus velezensis]|uniref:hypothetical protein n=1 Tax=Bacillus velezensis TaxID=492670 RepID=UPI000BA55BFF|nr:hypothetical protein [Bacillus velezensis]PAC78515.1 hypothetical protein CHI11_06395 [Bacillus velezensis]